MAVAKIEPSGCTVRKGKVQLRFCFYLEPDDPRYEEHHIQVSIIPPEGYPGPVDSEGSPVDAVDYANWIDSLPKKWQNNPFHNHFVYVDVDATDAEIKQLMVESLEEFLGIWVEGEDISKAWRERPLKSKRSLVPGNMPNRNTRRCQARVAAIVNRASEFEVRRA